MAIYYHATTTELSPGADPGLKSYDFSADAERLALEAFIEERRPTESFSRLSSWFTCDAPAKAAHYLEAELAMKPATDTAAEPRLYSVEIEHCSKQPMILVEAIRKCLSTKDIANAERLAKEYWTPTQPWSFWEYTSQAVTVIEEIDCPDLVQRSLVVMAYSGDSKRLKAFSA